MSDSSASLHYRKGIIAFDQGNTLAALLHFEQVPSPEKTPTLLSSLGYCLAKEQRDLNTALDLCNQAIRREPENPLHYHNLGRIYLLAQQKHLAIGTFRKGLKFRRHQGIIDEMKKLGARRPPVIASLGRKHLLNKYLGIFLDRLGMR